MKLSTLEIKKYHTDLYGIKESSHYRLPSLMCLVGKNGSGKSRTLNLIRNEIKINSLLLAYKNHLDVSPFNLGEKGFSRIKYNDKKFDPISELRHSQIILDPNNKIETNQQYLNLIHQLATNVIASQGSSGFDTFMGLIRYCDVNLRPFIKTLDYRLFKELNETRSSNIKFLPSKNGLSKLKEVLNPIVSLTDSKDRDLNNEEITSINKHALQYLDDLTNVLALEEIKEFRNPELLKNNVYFKKFTRLQELVFQILEKKLSYQINTDSLAIDDGTSLLGGLKGIPMLNNRKFFFKELSDGEKVLFGFAFLLFLHEENTNIQTKDSIIFIDEPETHLHPEIQVKLIKRLKKIIEPNGQLLIATHSLHIISSLEPDEIYLVEDNSLLNPSSRNISKTVESLFGFDEDYQKFKDFCFGEYEWGFRNFIAQCFQNPEVILSAKKNDPQIDLFRKSISQRNVLKILDFGAGGGRLCKELEKEISTNKIEYHAFNIGSEYDSVLKSCGTKKIYHKLDEIPENTFDCIVLCNVLHEISYNSLYDELNIVHNAINMDGYLIIIEDKILPRGEEPNENGYLVFTEKELKLLFSVDSDISLLKSTDNNYSERIMCAVIPKGKINSITKSAIQEAIELLKTETLQKAREIRTGVKNNFKSLAEKGRVAAFYTQQYVTIALALEDLKRQANDS